MNNEKKYELSEILKYYGNNISQRNLFNRFWYCSTFVILFLIFLVSIWSISKIIGFDNTFYIFLIIISTGIIVCVIINAIFIKIVKKLNNFKQYKTKDFAFWRLWHSSFNMQQYQEDLFFKYLKSIRITTIKQYELLLSGFQEHGKTTHIIYQ